MLALAEKAKKAEGEKRTKLEACMSDVVLWMGDVAMESEDYKQAVSIFAAYLAARRGRHTEDSRLAQLQTVAPNPSHPRSVAEAHFSLGTAQAHQGSYAEAENNLDCAIAVLEKRIAKLTNLGSSDFIAQEVITDIQEKIVDHKNMAFAEAEGLKRKNSNSSPVGKTGKAAKLNTAAAEGRIKSAKPVAAAGTAVA